MLLINVNKLSIDLGSCFILSEYLPDDTETYIVCYNNYNVIPLSCVSTNASAAGRQIRQPPFTLFKFGYFFLSPSLAVQVAVNYAVVITCYLDETSWLFLGAL